MELATTYRMLRSHVVMTMMLLHKRCTFDSYDSFFIPSFFIWFPFFGFFFVVQLNQEFLQIKLDIKETCMQMCGCIHRKSEIILLQGKTRMHVVNIEKSYSVFMCWFPVQRVMPYSCNAHFISTSLGRRIRCLSENEDICWIEPSCVPICLFCLPSQFFRADRV